MAFEDGLVQKATIGHYIRPPTSFYSGMNIEPASRQSSPYMRFEVTVAEGIKGGEGNLLFCRHVQSIGSGRSLISMAEPRLTYLGIIFLES